MEIDKIIGMIQTKSGMSADEANGKVEEKYQELSGLVTKEGAAYLVARQIGIDVPNGNEIKINDVNENSRNVNVVGRIVNVSRINKFKRPDGSEGTVGNIFIADSTGQVRITLWSDQTQMMSEFKLNDVVQIMNGMVKKNLGSIEISLGKYGGIRKIDDMNIIPPAEHLSKIRRVTIKDAKTGNAEIAGTVIQVFNGKFIYSSCSICGMSTNDKCKRHKLENSMVLSAMIDDGTDDMRVTMFGKVAQNVCGVDMQELASMGAEQRYQIIRNNLEGKDFVFDGRVKLNIISDKLELLAENAKALNALEESKKILNEIKGVCD